MAGYTSIVDATPAFVAGTFDAQDVRLAAMGEPIPGLFTTSDFTVSQRGAGANQSVDIGAGRAVVLPAATTHQGAYVARTEATFNTGSDGGYTWAASDGSNPRIDILGIEVADTDEAGSYTGFKFRVIDGTPNASATHQLAVTYWPALPTGFLPLAAILRPAGSTSITTSQITNLNPITNMAGRHANNYVGTAQTTTSATYARLTTPDFVMVYVPHAQARIRLFSEGVWKVSVDSGTQGIALFLNDVQLKLRNMVNGAPAAGALETTAPNTFMSRFHTVGRTGESALSAFFATDIGATADVSNVTTGVAGTTSSSTLVTSIDIAQLAAGWYVIEQRYKTSANTLTVDERYMWAEVIA